MLSAACLLYTSVTSGGPEGHFCYDNLRDSNKIIGIAGGCGITPFRSIAKSIIEGLLDIDLILFYGCNKKEDIIFYNEYKELEKNSDGKFKVVYVLAEEDLEGFEQGFKMCIRDSCIAVSIVLLSVPARCLLFLPVLNRLQRML